MADDPTPAPQAPVKPIPMRDLTAPVIYFDEAPIFGGLDGIVRITLVHQRSVPGDPGPDHDFAVAGYIRCSMRAAVKLRAAIDQSLLLMAPKGEGKAN